MVHSLEVYADGELVFWSDGRWLHPLLDLERYLAAHGRPPGELVASDKVVGRAAAMIMVHVGIDRIHAGMLSRLAQGFLEARGVPVTHDELVPRILCRTEELLADLDDPAEAYRIIRQRAEGAA